MPGAPNYSNISLPPERVKKFENALKGPECLAEFYAECGGGLCAALEHRLSVGAGPAAPAGMGAAPAGVEVAKCGDQTGAIQAAVPAPVYAGRAQAAPVCVGADRPVDSEAEYMAPDAGTLRSAERDD